LLSREIVIDDWSFLWNIFNRLREVTVQKKVPDLIRDIYRRMREAMGVEQSELARKIGVTVSRLSKWEHSKGSLRPEQVLRLGDELKACADAQAKKYAGEPLEVFTGQLFKQLREAHGISQMELAERAGLLQFTISMFETGHRQLKPRAAERLADAMKRAMQERREEIRMYQEMGANLLAKAIDTERTRQVDKTIESLEEAEKHDAVVAKTAK
jgi:transcriptional regulator with XRE-family HTH domain